MKILNRQKGSILISLVLILPAILFVTATFLQLAVSSLRLAKKDQLFTQAQFATDAGIDRSLYEVNADDAWAGTSGEVELHNDGSVRTTYEVTVTNNGAESKTLTSVGRSYWPVSNSTAASTVRVESSLRPVSSGGFSVVTGVGGLYMSNSAKILGGNVQVNGEVRMTNGAQIGLSSSPVDLNVAHQNCPNPATASYPQLCGSGENGQPISIANLAHIYGDVKANNQTDDDGMTDPGLTASSGVIPEDLPIHDRDAQKASITSEQTGATASCSGNTSKTWPANLKINGNVTISTNCTVTVSGDVWITGTLTLSNQGTLVVSDSLGTTRPNIMVDGSPTSVTMSNNSELLSNDDDTGFQIITYWSEASCSPDCSDVTGTDLYDSRDDTTISMDNSSDAAETILYARWSRVSVSNNGQIGALVGQTVQLSNSAAITFGTSVGTETSYWVIDGYRKIFN